MAESKVIAPKREDLVTSTHKTGIFEVVAVNSLMQTANLRLADGITPVIPNVARTALRSLNKK